VKVRIFLLSVAVLLKIDSSIKTFPDLLRIMAGGKQCTDAVSLLTCLMTFAMAKSFCTYPSEEPQVKNSKFNLVAIQAHEGLLKALQGVSQTLSFTRSCVKSAMKSLSDKKHFVIAEHTSSYVDIMTNRVLNMCHHVNQCMHKKPRPTWLQDMGLTMTPTQDDGSHDAKSSASVVYTSYDWDPGMLLAFRKTSDTSSRQYSLPVELDDDQADTDKIIARWDDGSMFTIEDMTVQAYRQQADQRGTKERDCLWTGSHTVTHHRLEIKQRPDKELKNKPLSTKLLMSLYEQGRQILQVRVCEFGHVQGDGQCLSPEDKTIKAALAFMQPIAIDYMMNKFPVDEIKDIRNKAFEKHKTLSQTLASQEASPLKKPAMAACAADAKAKASSVRKRPASACASDQDEQDENAEAPSPAAKFKASKDKAIKRPSSADDEIKEVPQLHVINPNPWVVHEEAPEPPEPMHLAIERVCRLMHDDRRAY
jgi:hypothetical protein